MPKFDTPVILLINQSKEICEKQFSVFGSKGGQISPLLHVPLLIEIAKIIYAIIKIQSQIFPCPILIWLIL